MNIKSQTPTIRSYGTPSIYSGTNLWTVMDISENPEVHDYHWFFNGKDSGVSANNGDFKPNYSATLFTGKDSFQKNLDLLNERINTIHKELSYWDLYKITHVITSSESFPAIISSLAVGYSAVINCDTFSYNNQVYRRGDVIVKISDSNELLIPAVNTGVFQPTSVDGNGNLIFQYTPVVNEQQVKVAGIHIASAGNTIYGQSLQLTPSATIPIPVEFLEEQIIKPVIKTFLQTDNDYEEIIIDQNDLTITYTSASTPTWNITLHDTIADNTIWIQVK